MVLSPSPTPSPIIPDVSYDPELPASNIENAALTGRGFSRYCACLTRWGENRAHVEDSFSEKLNVLRAFEEEFKQAESRTVKPDIAADLVNRLRLIRTDQGQILTNANRMKRITAEDTGLWYQAQGLEPQDVSRLRRAAFLSGLPTPSGALLGNFLQYVVSPIVSYACRNQSWIGLGFGVGIAALICPMNGFQQIGIVALSHSLRYRLAPSINLDQERVNYQFDLSKLANTLRGHLQTLEETNQRLIRCIQDCGLDMNRFDQLNFNLLLPEQQDALLEVGTQWLSVARQVQQTQNDLWMTQSLHDDLWIGTVWQAIPRTLRAPLVELSTLLRHTTLPGSTTSLAQMSSMMILTLGQHLASAFDTRASQDYMNRQNLLYGHFFTEEGLKKLNNGLEIGENDIDRHRLRGLVKMPAQILATQVVKVLEKSVSIENQRDLEHLQSGNFTQLQTNGLAENLVVDSKNRVFSKVFIHDIASKYTFSGFSAQTSQRVGQALHLVLFGSAVSSVISGLVKTFSGGLAQSSPTKTVGLAALSGFMAGVGAFNVYTAVAIRNHRTAAKPDIGFIRQSVRGVIGGLGEFLAQRAGRQVVADATRLMVTEPMKQLRAFVLDMTSSTGMDQPVSNPAK